jgi:hypothetical protein
LLQDAQHGGHRVRDGFHRLQRFGVGGKSKQQHAAERLELQQPPLSDQQQRLVVGASRSSQGSGKLGNESVRVAYPVLPQRFEQLPCHSFKAALVGRQSFAGQLLQYVVQRQVDTPDGQRPGSTCCVSGLQSA